MTGKELKNLRESKAISQVKFAELTGKSQKDISRYENEKVKITKSNEILMKKVLQCKTKIDIEELLMMDFSLKNIFTNSELSFDEKTKEFLVFTNYEEELFRTKDFEKAKEFLYEN